MNGKVGFPFTQEIPDVSKVVGKANGGKTVAGFLDAQDKVLGSPYAAMVVRSSAADVELSKLSAPDKIKLTWDAMLPLLDVHVGSMVSEGAPSSYIGFSVNEEKLVHLPFPVFEKVGGAGRVLSNGFSLVVQAWLTDRMKGGVQESPLEDSVWISEEGSPGAAGYKAVAKVISASAPMRDGHRPVSDWDVTTEVAAIRSMLRSRTPALQFLEADSEVREKFRVEAQGVSVIIRSDTLNARSFCGRATSSTCRRGMSSSGIA